MTPWTPIVAIADYAVTIGIDPRLASVVPSVVVGQGIMPKNSQTQLPEVTDGQGLTREQTRKARGELGLIAAYGVGLAMALGLFAGLMPAWGAYRARVAETLRGV